MSDNTKYTRSTKRLIEEWQEGLNRDDAFRSLFERYQRPISHFFRKRGFVEEDIRDLTQETFVAVHRGMRNFRQEASFETWLFQIAANLWRSELRHRTAAKRSADEVPVDPLSSEHFYEGEEDGDEETDPDKRALSSDEQGQLEQILAREQMSQLRDALEELPPQMRACMLLRVGQGLKYREIAAVMNMSLQTVKSHLHQARARLHEKLGTA